MKISIEKLDGKIGNRECIKEIIELWNQNAIETADCKLEERDKKGIEEQLVELIQSRYGAVFVVTDESNNLIGYGIGSIKQDLVTDMLYGQIEEVYVKLEYRRQQIAQSLVGNLRNWLNQENVSLIHVYVDLDNKLALDFWENTGFEKEFFLLSNS
ncbi:GNAT family N-acetyltransferase [Bacillus albus]|uniref:GNAT family N-acetyltransferase n=1 Tax=Bacillus TaxID=1386 RepID=UPI000D8B8138|nr:GNAT family N-acetyltransferase [Bacillus cereus]HDR3652474.1 GNAT family N-acetyltransferase [Bacillus anthracis]PYD94771.1 GNAT family N-acetyltransferase [Bacillus cereus]HDR3653398.1 GNAT family N-acetyltransferase [Bacillus anthracis]HDR4594595.1 GNAT family N-acetyltransferase [Bacillus cereus]HDR4611454.1 GNAT family N-acetyltransferase [Bacillus cereus]